MSVFTVDVKREERQEKKSGRKTRMKKKDLVRKACLFVFIRYVRYLFVPGGWLVARWSRVGVIICLGFECDGKMDLNFVIIR